MGGISSNNGGDQLDANQLTNLLKNYLKKSDLDDIMKRMQKCEDK